MKSKLIILSVFCIFLISPIASACEYDLPAGDAAVDWGKGIQWTGSPSYSSEWNGAISTWNDMKKVKISKDTILTIEDLYIVDVYSPGIPIFAGYANRTVSGNFSHTSNNTPCIQVNTATMSPFSSAEKQKTLTHELGHALGIGEISITGNIMEQGRFNQTYLGPKDKEVYICLWG